MTAKTVMMTGPTLAVIRVDSNRILIWPMVTTREATQTHCQGLLSHSSLVAQTTPRRRQVRMPQTITVMECLTHHQILSLLLRTMTRVQHLSNHSLLITTVNHPVLKLCHLLSGRRLWPAPAILLLDSSCIQMLMTFHCRLPMKMGS